MNNILSILLILFLDCISTASSFEEANVERDLNYSTRTADTCADPSLAVTYVEAFLASPGSSAHALSPRSVFVNLDTTLGNEWQIQGEVFRAWTTAQDFTIPVYQLISPSLVDWFYVASPNGNPPTVTGYNTGGIVFYAYSTQVCGSVPLLAAFQAAAGDHWYTTDPVEHSNLLSLGWTDAGIIAYVLPLSCSCSP